MVSVLWAMAAVAEPATTASLTDFDRTQPLAGWRLQQVRGRPMGDGRVRLEYPAWTRWRGKWPAAILHLGEGGFEETDWRPYDRLVFAVVNEGQTPAQLRLRLDDRDGRRAIRVFPLPAGQRQVCQVSLAGLDRELSLAGVVRFDLYMSQPAADHVLHLEPLRLEADPLTLVQAELRVDPFGSGPFQVRAALSRAARWQVRVIDEEGRTAALRQGNSRRIEWHGEQRLPGRYWVELTAAEAVWETGDISHQLGAFEVVPEAARASLALWSEPTTRKVMLHDRPRAGQPFFSGDRLAAGQAGPVRIEMARNEWEGTQLVLLTRQDSTSFRLVVGPLRHLESGAAFPREENAVYQVGYVFTQDPGVYAVDFSGWWPDPLLPAETLHAVPGECMPVWIALKSRTDTEPGEYRGGVDIWKDGEWFARLPLEVRVYDATLPDSSSVRTAFSLYHSMLEQVYGKDLSPALYRKYQEFIADRRLNVDYLYRRHPPPLADLRHFSERGQLNAFNILYLPAGEDYSRAGLERLAAGLDPYVEDLRRLGLAERAYFYGFDEVTGDRFDEIRRVFGFLKQRYPEIKTATTARDLGLGMESGLSQVVDIWVPLTAAYDPAAAAQARARGDEVWWYICIAPHHPFANWFVEYPAIEARLLWWMTFRQRVTGFLYYTMNRWPTRQSPMRLDGYNKTDWDPASFQTANGDGCLLYAGPEGPITTIRLENVRDGLEDYELLRLLGGAAADELTDRLIGSLSEYSRDVEEFARVRRELLERLEHRQRD